MEWVWLVVGGDNTRLAVAMPLKSSGRNGNHTGQDSKANGHGDEDSSNSDCDSSLYDEAEAERRKVDCLDDMQFLEQQFSDLKELLFHEKVREIDERMKHISEEQADEYLQPLKELEEARQRRIKTAELQYSCKLQNIQNKYDEEVVSAQQDCQELIQVTKQRMIASLQDKIKKLHEDKIISELTKENGSRKRKKTCEFLLPDKRKKPVTVNGPCVIYMLRDMDIMEDLYDIRKGQATQEVTKKALFRHWT